MTRRTPRERVLRALDALLPYLHGFVNQALDASALRGKRVAADIGPLAHAIKDEWRGIFAARLNGSTRNYVHELLDIRNRLSHSKPFDDESARRACDTVRLVAKAIGAPLADYDRLASSDTEATATAAARAAVVLASRRTTTPIAPVRAGLRQRRVSQRDVMRAIWARCAPDEDRAIREYATAEHRGEVSRKQNASGLTSEQYARALLADGLAKGWLSDEPRFPT